MQNKQKSPEAATTTTIVTSRAASMCLSAAAKCSGNMHKYNTQEL